MRRAVIHSGEDVPDGTPFTEWTNALPGWLYLQLSDGTLLTLAPGGRIQVPRRDLARAPELEPWLEGLELRGSLRRSA
jgi:hypothetical protein